LSNVTSLASEVVRLIDAMKDEPHKAWIEGDLLVGDGDP
jgi:hypothetical protein